jgi:hypothetical protein
MTAAVSLDIEQTLLSGLDAPDGMLLQISDTALLCSENNSMELCSVVAFVSFFNNTVLSFSVISWSHVFFSAAFFGKDTRSNGITATETECTILNSSTPID